MKQAFPKPTRKPIKRRSPKRKQKQELDLLVRKIVFARDGHKCVAHGQHGVFCNSAPMGQVLQAAHVKPKGKYQRLRWEPDNILTMCFFHHMIWSHKDPLAFSAWFREAYPGREEKLNLMAATATKVDMKLLKIGLEIESRETEYRAF